MDKKQKRKVKTVTVPIDVDPRCVDMQPVLGFELNGRWVMEEQPVDASDWVLQEPPSLDAQVEELLAFVYWQEQRP